MQVHARTALTSEPSKPYGTSREHTATYRGTAADSEHQNRCYSWLEAGSWCSWDSCGWWDYLLQRGDSPPLAAGLDVCLHRRVPFRCFTFLRFLLRHVLGSAHVKTLESIQRICINLELMICIARRPANIIYCTVNIAYDSTPREIDPERLYSTCKPR